MQIFSKGMQMFLQSKGYQTIQQMRKRNTQRRALTELTKESEKLGLYDKKTRGRVVE